jgi:hypothetical protein
MDRFNALGRGMQVMFVAGVLLLIDTFLHWQSVDLGVIEVGRNAWHGFWGVVLGLLTIVLVLWLIARLAAIDIPLPISPTLTAAGLGVLIFLFALLKVLTDDYRGTWAWVGLILAAAILVGAWLQVQASGGMDALKSELPSMPASPGGSSSTAAAPPPTPAAGPSDTAAPAPPPPAAASPPMGEPAAPPMGEPAPPPMSEPPAPPETESTEERT